MAAEFLGTIDGTRSPRAVRDPLAHTDELVYFVKFDEPQMDAANLGPFVFAAIWDRYIVRLE